MATKQRGLAALVVALIAVAAFGAGTFIGGYGGAHPTIYTAAGHVGVDEASFQVGDTTYGFQSTVSWTDSTGSFHTSGWPDCLPKLQEVAAVRFAATVQWVGATGMASVLWVDCQGH